MSETQTLTKPKKPFYKKWWFIAVIAIIAFSAMSSSLNGRPDSEATSSESSSESGTSAPTESGSETESEADYLLVEYGDFETISASGSGDDVVVLPAGVSHAVITASYSGSSNFIIQSLDSNNEMSELLVNKIGNYDGNVALGFSVLGNPADKLQVQADGEWEISISPIHTAAALPSSGSGDGVFLYNGDAPIWNITHDGSSNFIFIENTSEAFSMGLLVNEIGSYEGTVTGSAGPSVITISADGNWTISE